MYLGHQAAQEPQYGRELLMAELHVTWQPGMWSFKDAHSPNVTACSPLCHLIVHPVPPQPPPRPHSQPFPYDQWPYLPRRYKITCTHATAILENYISSLFQGKVVKRIPFRFLEPTQDIQLHKLYQFVTPPQMTSSEPHLSIGSITSWITATRCPGHLEAAFGSPPGHTGSI